MSTHVYRRYVIDTGGSRKPKPPTSSASQYSQRLETIRNRINKKFTFTLFQLNDPSYKPDSVTLGRTAGNPGDKGGFRTRRTRSDPDVARYIARIAAINKAMSPTAPAPAPPRLKSFNLNDIWASDGAASSSGGMISNADAAPSAQTAVPKSNTAVTVASTVAVCSAATTTGKTKRKRGDSDDTPDNGETAQVSEPRSMGADLTNTVGSNLSSKAAGKKKARVGRDQGKASKEQATFAPQSTATTASAPAAAITSMAASYLNSVRASVPSAPAPLTETAVKVPAPPASEPTPEVYLGIYKSRPLDIKSTPISLATSRVVVMADILEALSPFACDSGDFTPTYVLPVTIPKNYISKLKEWPWDAADPRPNERVDPLKTLYDRVFRTLNQPNQPYALENEFRIFKRLPSIFHKENILHMPDAVADRLEKTSQMFPDWSKDFDEEFMVSCIVQAIVCLSEGWEEEGFGESVIGCMRF